MAKLPALLIPLQAIKRDPAIQAGNRGARKVLVTRLLEKREIEAGAVVWSPPTKPEKCPVQVAPNIELAIFTQQAEQDRHYHKSGTEFYSLLEGQMTIEVEGQRYALTAGDMIIVNPGSIHQILPVGSTFLCQVITANCGGVSDKYTL